MANNENDVILMVAAFNFAADGIAEKDDEKFTHTIENCLISLALDSEGMCTINNKTVIHVNLTICV
jgi:hypothetical protein